MSMVITIRTSAAIREFLVGRNGSEIIKLDSNDVMFRKIKALLKSPPSDYIPSNHNEVAVKVELSQFRFGKAVYNSESFNYLSDKDQKAISDDWEDMFYDIFHHYVLAFCKGMKFKVPCQKLAIEDFCDEYNLDMAFIKYDTLKKSWDRSDLKKKYREFFPRMKK